MNSDAQVSKGLASNELFYTELYDQFARIGKAVSNGHRIALLDFLAQGERCVESLANLANLSVANTSRHLQHLKEAGLVRTRKDGQFVYYRLADDNVLKFLKVLRNIAAHERVAIPRLVESYLSTRDSLSAVSGDEVQTRMRDGEPITIIDVRPPAEYRAGHVRGAINIPLEELAAHIQHLPKESLLVVYCRGPYCVLAYDAVNQLRAGGFNAQRMDEGYPEWKLAGLPIDEKVANANNA